MGLGVGIWALRLGFGPQDWDLGLKAGIWASRLRYGPGGWGEGGTEKKEKEKEKEEKIPHMCESVGHRPLWGRCPKRKDDIFIQFIRLKTNLLW